jgi:exodeoxyribonuclease V alpha subunit
MTDCSSCQAAQSRIVLNAHRVNRGQMRELDASANEGSDFFFVEASDPDDAARKIVEIVRNRIPGRFGLDPIRDVQVLCPMNRGRLGTRTLNLCRWPSTATKASRRWCGLDGPFASTTKSCR